MAKLKLALLSGGVSPEREISIQSGDNVFNALDKEKYEILRYDTKTELTKFFIDASTRKFDIVFPMLHGIMGEDGRLQGMLDMIGMSYVFSGPMASSLAMNKHKSKIVARETGVAVPKDILLVSGDKFDMKELIAELSFPVLAKRQLSLPIVLKPVDLGSSIGVNVVHKKEDLASAIKDAFSHNTDVLIEEYIKGRELTVPVIGNRFVEALPVIEIIPKKADWFDHKSKYEEGGADEICPAIISDDIKSLAQNFAIRIYKEIGCKDLARVDFIWDNEKGILNFIEINSIPGMTERSLVPISAEAEGIHFPELLDRLIKGALKFYNISHEL